MLSGVSITCFAASYVVVLALELSRLLFRSGIRGAVLLGFAAAGLFAHTVYLANRAIDTADVPLSSQQDWYLVAAWILAATYLYLASCHRERALGVFVLPLVLSMLIVAAFAADATPSRLSEATRTWGLIHSSSILAATVVVVVGFVFGLMYLVQAARLKRKLPPRQGFKLPSLEWLQTNNGRAIVLSAVLMAIGVASGVVLNLIDRADRLPWYDPLTLVSLAMFGWLAIAAGLSLIHKPTRQGRKVAYLTMADFVFLVFALAVGLMAQTQHGGRGSEGAERQASATAIYLSMSDDYAGNASVRIQRGAN